VYQLSLEHSWLQHQRGVLEVHAGKKRALTRQPEIWNFQRVIVVCPIDKTAGVDLPSPMRIRIGEFWEDGRLLVSYSSVNRLPLAGAPFAARQSSCVPGRAPGWQHSSITGR
jgi:hypothetical protein